MKLLVVIKRLFKKLGNVRRGETSGASLFSPDMKSFTIFIENNKTQVFESNFSIETHTVEVFFMSIIIDTSNIQF